ISSSYFGSGRQEEKDSLYHLILRRNLVSALSLLALYIAESAERDNGIMGVPVSGRLGDHCAALTSAEPLRVVSGTERHATYVLAILWQYRPPTKPNRKPPRSKDDPELYSNRNQSSYSPYPFRSKTSISAKSNAPNAAHRAPRRNPQPKIHNTHPAPPPRLSFSKRATQNTVYS
ncbi:uncharacterized protein H6S33_007091, partial [Morchella sextelata]|uniref:uncharacterized protein n=1 Tax=Morchella sextelata TaxID=1174677 RepID=UPI001D04E184